MRKRFIVGLIGVVLAVVASSPASAHVLIVDRQTNIAAVLHINPDDDPVAGESSQLFFDVQDGESNVRVPYGAYQLVVTDDHNNQTVVVTHNSNNTVAAEYKFPTRGLYQLNLRSSPAYDALQRVSLQTSVRVSRGAGVANNADRYPWATAGLWIGGVLLAMLVVQAVVNWWMIIAGAHF